MNTIVEHKDIPSGTMENMPKKDDNLFIKLYNYFTNKNTCIGLSCVCILAMIIFLMLLWVQKDLIMQKPKVSYSGSFFSNTPYDL